ncbi:exopolysaccharide biosynthesis protein [Leptolyngbya sp. FACHB-261]|uniref:exopolysaccharide biosynthesis protein n=1 Tax=Leptolyngbya sp. FACHB-261 TaxID=2692806 RepID=UPI0016865CE2|nr:exopolysaccharide biosynthesis protein [Leptolyngbya sp. FACHB-261]MBD2104874.1 exopolysaccharide biosynthesis protein [Leptolyngbya sp. FACHB-261]
MKFSQDIQALLEEYAQEPLPLGKLLERTGEHGFGMMSALLTLPFLSPIPIPGFSTVLGAGIVLLGTQLSLGFRKPWLPKRIAQVELSPKVTAGLLKTINWILRPLERVVRPRLSVLIRNPLQRRLIGLSMAWAAILMALPLPPIIPFTNTFPAYAILFLAIGTIEFDGFLIMAGHGMTVATTLYFVTIAGAIWALLLNVWERLQQFL